MGTQEECNCQLLMVNRQLSIDEARHVGEVSSLTQGRIGGDNRRWQEGGMTRCIMIKMIKGIIFIIWFGADHLR